MLAKGDNTFKIPHQNKQTAARKGRAIPRVRQWSAEPWEAAQSVQELG